MQMKRIKAREENFYQDSIENKQKGKIKVGIILSIAVLQVRGVESLETASEAIFKFTHAYIKNLP